MKFFFSGNCGTMGRAPECLIPAPAIMLSFVDFAIEHRTDSKKRLRHLLETRKDRHDEMAPRTR